MSVMSLLHKFHTCITIAWWGSKSQDAVLEPLYFEEGRLGEADLFQPRPVCLPGKCLNTGLRQLHVITLTGGPMRKYRILYC